MAIDQELAGGLVIEAHDALDERRLARSILAKQRMEGARSDLDRDLIERCEGAEAHGHGSRIDADGVGGHGASFRSMMIATGPPPGGP